MLKDLFNRNTGAHMHETPEELFENEVMAMQHKTDKLIAMLNEEIKSLNWQINKTYKLMGESFFENYNKLDNNAILAKTLHDNKQHVDKISELLGSIKNKEVKINELGERLEDEIEMLRQLYSRESGGSLSRPYSIGSDEDETSEGRVIAGDVAACGKCGMEYQAGLDKFCAECGNRL